MNISVLKYIKRPKQMNKADLIRFFIWNYKFGFIYEVTYKTRATYKYCRLPLLLIYTLE